MLFQSQHDLPCDLLQNHAQVLQALHAFVQEACMFIMTWKQSADLGHTIFYRLPLKPACKTQDHIVVLTQMPADTRHSPDPAISCRATFPLLLLLPILPWSQRSALSLVTWEYALPLWVTHSYAQTP